MSKIWQAGMRVGNSDKCVMIRGGEYNGKRDKLFVFPTGLIRRSQHCNRYKIRWDYQLVSSPRRYAFCYAG
jgi:hypothetical protein